MSVPRANSGHPQRDTAGAANTLDPFSRHVIQVAWVVQHASVWWQIVMMQRYEEARVDFSRVREMLVVEVVSEG